MKKKKSFSKLYLYGAIGCIAVIAIVGYIYCFSSFSKSSNTEYVYIDSDDNIDSVYNKLRPFAKSIPFQAFKTLTLHSGYADHIRTGRYAIAPGDGALKTWRHMKNGLQEPVSLTIPSVRTLDKLSDEIGKKMMFGSNDLYHALRDESVCQKYGYDTATIACMFVPNTYDLYWNISVDKFLERMKKESDKFWNFERTEKAKAMKLTPVEIITLASIVDEETANNGEKPMIAGMYYKRIYNNLLSIKSPYNTYKNPGLPPGPIRIPSVAGIDAVLNHVHHDYLYMCAKEDFSGTHNFARTYDEHLQNAAKYSKALNERGIK